MGWEQLSLDLDLPKSDYGLIGLSGYARSGKDTVASMLVERWGYTRVGFADAIREFLLQVNPILSDGHRLGEVVKMHGWEIAKAQTEVRRLLQETGMAARNMFGEDFWVKVVLEKINPTDKVVITDVRFTNEATMIKMLGGQVWRVERPGIAAVNAHVSESDMDSYVPDQVIVNGGSIDDLALLIQTRMSNAQPV